MDYRNAANWKQPCYQYCSGVSALRYVRRLSVSTTDTYDRKSLVSCEAMNTAVVQVGPHCIFSLLHREAPG